MNFYDFNAVKMNGQTVSMADYKDKVVIVVNTASKCGFTPQFAGLEELYDNYKDKGLEILGFPTNQFGRGDAAENEKIEEFCQLNYGVKFTMFKKIQVNGGDAHPLFKFLKKEARGAVGNSIKWNFTKFLINREGIVTERFAPATAPKEMIQGIEKIL
ncbi:glutathione peroxidase [Lactovum miscens]|uniref:Glutathione peroxidase n=1 Tax=Lactovum miscens TaxID=190387 RepID=A0A841C9N6_9LACT|nr:glutathione peroxidase [Lactovum miscens]MBB5888438.1 glutathione peroxidase [Lactovum miscens]